LDYTNSISFAIGNIYGPLQDLGVDLVKKTHYIGILASRNALNLHQDMAGNGYLLGVLKTSVVDGNGALGLALSRKNNIFTTPFDGCREQLKRLRTNSGYTDDLEWEKEWYNIAVSQRVHIIDGMATKRSRQDLA
jgi:hypothetical protein